MMQYFPAHQYDTAVRGFLLRHRDLWVDFKLMHMIIQRAYLGRANFVSK
jgi:hypothetical protein